MRGEADREGEEGERGIDRVGERGREGGDREGGRGEWGGRGKDRREERERERESNCFLMPSRPGIKTKRQSRRKRRLEGGGEGGWEGGLTEYKREKGWRLRSRVRERRRVGRGTEPLLPFHETNDKHRIQTFHRREKQTNNDPQNKRQTRNAH